MKRFIFVMLLILLLTGCASAPKKVQAPPAPTVLTLWHSYQGDARKGLELAQKELEKTNPGYQLQLVYVPADTFWTKLTQGLAADKGPDLFLAKQDKLPGLYVDGSIQPLDGIIDTGKYFKASIEALSFNGNVLGVPKSIQVPLLTYNRDLVPEAPTSLEQLIDKANKITKGQAIGLAGDLSNSYLSQQLFSAYGGQLFAADQKPNLNSPEATAFLQEITLLLNVKGGTYDPASSQGLLATGTTTFGLMNSPELNAYKGLGKNLGFMGFPGPAGKEGKPYVKAEGFVVSSNCKVPKLAAAAAAYFASQPALEKYSIPYGEFPADPTVYEQKTLKDNPEAQLVKHLATIGLGNPLDSRSNLISPLLSQAVKDVLSGVATADAAQNAQTKAIQALGLDKP